MANPTSNAPGPPSNGPKASKEGSGRPHWRPQPWWVIFLVIMIANYAATQLFFPEPSSITIPYTFFKKQVEAGNVEDITSVGDSIQGRFKTKVTYPPPKSDAPTGNAPAPPSADQPKSRISMQFKTRRPAFADQDLEKRLDDQGVVINAEDDDGLSWFKLLVSFGPTLLLIGAFVWISRRTAAAAGGGLFGLGRSRAKRYSEEQPKVTFEDVAGIDEAENELIEIVDFLKHPAKYQRLGGTVPKGVLLVGAPGTGKTLLARAIAGQAGVPFVSLSASEFIEMIVGVGASRGRDLFKEAREAAPAIIFIDELDAIGRARGSGAQLGGNDEREQTLNQILTEMDGFDSREGVIVLAATNRADVLDQALLRPGRFDPGSWSSGPTGPAGPRFSRCTPRMCPWRLTSPWSASPPKRRAWSAPSCATSSTKRRSSRRARMRMPSMLRILPTPCRRSPSALRVTSCSTRRIGSALPITRQDTPCSRC